MFDYINKYRVKNGKKALVWSDKSYKVSVKQSEDMVKNDSSYHSDGSNRWTSENCIYSKSGGFIGSKMIKPYVVFIKKYFNLSYDDVLKDSDMYFISYTIFLWSNDAQHNRILLSGSNGSVHIIIKDVYKKPNVVMGKEIFPGCGNFYYKGLVSSTFNTY